MISSFITSRPGFVIYFLYLFNSQTESWLFAYRIHVLMHMSSYFFVLMPLDIWPSFGRRKSQTNLPSNRDLLERAFMRVLSFDTILTNKRVTI